MTVIAEVAAGRLSTPLRAPWVTALRRATSLQSVVVRLTDGEGCHGFGEAAQVWRVTGESMAGIEACVLGPLADLLLGWDWEQPLDRLHIALESEVVGNSGARAACETAACDLAARRRGVPLHLFLGGAGSTVTTDVTVAADAAPETSKSRADEGFRHLKVKVGVAADDIVRVRRIHDEAGCAVRIRIDANQGWDLRTSVAAVEEWLRSGVDLEFVEQPLHRTDLAGHAALRRALPVPLMLDETVFTSTDLDRAIDLGCADLINVKLAKCGGIHAGLALIRRAQEAGLGVMVGSMMESGIGVTAAASLANVVAPDIVHDLDAAWWSAGVETPSERLYRGNKLVLSGSPGIADAVGDLSGVEWTVRAH